MKLLNTVVKEIAALTRINRKLYVGKLGQFKRKSKNPFSL